jgi:ribosome modulation factor
MSADLLRARIIRLEAELEIRTMLYVLVVPPPTFRRAGYRSAYQSGYESGWRHKPSLPPYDREHLRSAWRQGYDDGLHASELAIIQVIERPLPAKDKTA